MRIAAATSFLTAAAAAGAAALHVGAFAVAPAHSAGVDPLIAGAPCPDAGDSAAPLWRQRRAILCLVDTARRRAGLAALPQDVRLDRAAVLKESMLARCDEFTHTPCGVRDFAVGFRRAGYLDARAYAVGENLIWAPAATTPSVFVALWLRSPEHRRNILDPRWTAQGLAGERLAAYVGARDVTLWTSTFGERS